MATWYCVNYWGNQISPVDVLSETKSTVLVKLLPDWSAITQKKISNSSGYYPTWEQAHTALLSSCENRVIEARRLLAVANDKLGNVKGMKPPKAEAV